jgi:hypothetical protein
VGYLPELRKSQMERRTINSILGFFSSLLEDIPVSARFVDRSITAADKLGKETEHELQ